VHFPGFCWCIASIGCMVVCSVAKSLIINLQVYVFAALLTIN
jgi:hypothetical protein